MGRYKVRCRICGRFFSKIDWSHLKKHNITFKKYKIRFPNSKTQSELTTKKFIKNGSKNIKYILEKPKKLRSKWGKKTGILGVLSREDRRKRDLKYNKHWEKTFTIGQKKRDKKRKKRRKNDPKFDKKLRKVSRKNGIKTQKIMKQKSKQDYNYEKWLKERQSLGQIKAQKIIKKRRQEDPKFDKYLRKCCSIAGFIGLKKLRENSPFWFMGVPFASPSERECAKLFYKHLNWIPKEGVNCHIQIGRCEYDFKISGCFVEYHPKSDLYDTTIKIYYQKRRRNLDKNNLKNKKLFILQNLEDVMNFINIEKFNKK
jgi:hypothetical protein